VARRCVLFRNFENEEAKARYGAVENITKGMYRQENKQTTNKNSKYVVSNTKTAV